MMERLSISGLQDLFDRFLGKKLTLEDSLRSKFIEARSHLADLEKKAVFDLRKSCEYVENMFARVREIPAALDDQLTTIQETARSLIEKIEGGPGAFSILDLITAETDRLLPLGEQALSDMDIHKEIPAALEELISALNVDFDPAAVESICRVNSVVAEETHGCDVAETLEKRSERSYSFSEAQFPAPAPFNEPLFSEFLSKISTNSVSKVDFGPVGCKVYVRHR
jgi:hypothetical protein